MKKVLIAIVSVLLGALAYTLCYAWDYNVAIGLTKAILFALLWYGATWACSSDK